ncbi:uncharacterized protein LOC110832323 [Zootermopsis nevadensis]|uniref:uncharacterized protein LOC110832323 n=1 Tax=Zootermopsis nevadensis TaxID=136037 RepID=UPI000B8EB33A|nr:uncharacterized protein LOC110832323 [Zootermopsis nevadensis]XP_021924925.1 uncharacterized protein LOC110832323 [Zootermopsis nevadensis]XP_021924944.1 uncharacterized protein LOC110832323 [Zootermopsis nevadensis]XP_021924950.1 uncharacterized protein LOC110832323 [Zootermopsis nevadensis]
MSLLAELEELQRCLEGTGDSDSEEAGSPVVLSEECKLFEKEVEPSLTRKNESGPSTLAQNSASKYPSLSESSCKISNVEEENACTDAGNIATKEFSVGLGQSAANSSKFECSAQVSQSRASSWGSVDDKAFTSEGCRQGQKTSGARTITVKSVSPGSQLPLANSNKDSANVKVSEAEILVVSSVEKCSPSKNVKILALKQNEVPSLMPEVKELSCRVPDISVVKEGLLNAVSQSTHVSKMDRGSPVSDSKVVPVPSLALVNEEELIVKKVKLEDKKDADDSALEILKEPPLDLQTDANRGKKAVVMLTSLVIDKNKMQEVKLLGPRVKLQAAESDFVASNKPESESSDVQQHSSALKVVRSCMNSSQGRKPDLEHIRGVGTTCDVQPTSDSPVFSVDSKISSLEDLKILNGGPPIKIVEVLSDSNKTENKMVGISTGSSGSVFISKANVLREASFVNSPPVVTKRKMSFDTGPDVGHILGEKFPLVSVDASECRVPEEPETNNAESNTNKRKISTETGPLPSNTAISELVSGEKFSLMSSESQKDISSKTPEPKLLDVFVNEKKGSVDSESLSYSATLGQNSKELCRKLGHKEGIFSKGSNLVDAKRHFDTPLLKKRRASYDPLEMNPASRLKRRKRSASEVTDLVGEVTLNSESGAQNPGRVNVARAPTTKTVPITSTMEVTISPHGVEQNMQTIPVSKSEENRVHGDDAALEKEGPCKKLMDARIVLKKLSIPVPEHILPLSAQNERIGNTKQKLHKTLEEVSTVLQETLIGSSAVNKRKVGKPKKFQDHLLEPIKEQKVMRRLALQQKIIAKPEKQKLMGKQTHHKIVGKTSQLKIMKKSSQQKLVAKPKQQKNIRKPVQQQESVSKPKTFRRTSSTNLPSIAVRIGVKRKKKKVIPKKVVSSKNKTKSQKVGPSTMAKKTIKQISFANPRYKQGTKLAVNRRPEDKTKIVAMQDKNVALNRSKENNFHRKDKMMVPKLEMVPLLMKVKESDLRAAKTVRQKNPVAVKKQPAPKKVYSDDKKTKKSRQIPVEPSKLDGGDSVADDEWIVEVLLDDTEIDMMAVTSQVEVGQDANISKVSSSDDRLKELLVSSSVLGAACSFECDSSTDMNRGRKTAFSGDKILRRTISASRGKANGTFLDTNVKPIMALPDMKQALSSFNIDERTSISAEKKMVEMRKAIGDLERIADRSMLRLKAEERQVMYLTSRLHEYENDKHHRMLRTVLRDGAPGPNQNPDAMFILDLLLSYCPEDSASVSS